MPGPTPGARLLGPPTAIPGSSTTSQPQPRATGLRLRCVHALLGGGAKPPRLRGMSSLGARSDIECSLGGRWPGEGVRGCVMRGGGARAGERQPAAASVAVLLGASAGTTAARPGVAVGVASQARAATAACRRASTRAVRASDPAVLPTSASA